MKQCSKCKEWKDESEFYKEKGKKDGLRNDCKECANKKEKQRYENNKEEIKQKKREYYWNHKEQQDQKSREYNEVHREELNQKSREYNEVHREELNEKHREYNKIHKEEISQKDKERNNSPLPYDSKIRQELELYEEVKESENGNIKCRCTYDGDWFEPTKQQIQSRIKAINGEVKGDGVENRLYCSEACKQSCSIYYKHWYERGYEPTTSREVQPALRKMVFARDDYICVACKWHKDDLIKLGISLHCHHTEGVQQNPIESADMDKCETRCSVCHKKVHQIPGNTYNDLKCPSHLKYNK